MIKLLIIPILTLMALQLNAKEHKISQKDKKFDKKELTIEPGDVVIFMNVEKDVTHNVYSLGPKNSFELKTQPPGQKSSVTFADAGDTEVECAIHPGMKLKVKVAGKDAAKPEPAKKK